MNKDKVIKGLRAIGKVQKTLTDEQAIACADIYPEWNGDGKQYAVGDRVTYSEKLYKVLQAHTSQAGWEPDAAPSLFAKLLPGQGGTEVGEWEQPGSDNGYMTGDRCRFEGEVYESTIDNNAWSPADYPAGWKKIG